MAGSPSRPGQRTAQTAYRAGRQSSAAIGRAVRSAGGLSGKLVVHDPVRGWCEVCDDGEPDSKRMRPYNMDGE